MAAWMTEEEVAAFQRDGAVCLRGVFKDWVETMTAGIERNLRERGPYAADNLLSDEPGRFFDDYCNWERIPEFRKVIFESPAAEIAATAMQSQKAQFFHDHVLVKEPGTQRPTPWHQDIPYYFTEGQQTVSFWIPVDPVKEATLRMIAGSHRWEKMVLPVRWKDNSDFFTTADQYLPVPDPDNDPNMQVLEWAMQPGDAVLFNFATVHGARGNPTAARRRALSLRWVGDDVRYVERPGRTSPPYPGHNMQPGDVLREDWVPVVWEG